jgi:AraC-like DNA-binding protein
MHRRTMNRHLSKEGLAFRHIADEVRFEIACELLLNTEMALAQIATVLQFSEQSAFSRAFRRWSGQTPSDWRRSHLPSPEAFAHLISHSGAWPQPGHRRRSQSVKG